MNKAAAINNTTNRPPKAVVYFSLSRYLNAYGTQNTSSFRRKDFIDFIFGFLNTGQIVLAAILYF